MSDNQAIDQAATDATAAAAVKAKPVLTKEERIAKVDAEIARLQAKRDDIVNDRITAPKAKAPVYVPEAGAKVLATVGRATATTQPKVYVGEVIAVKAPELDAEGKAKGATQVRVRINAGTFDEQIVTLYPAALQPYTEAEEGEPAAEGESAGFQNDGFFTA